MVCRKILKSRMAHYVFSLKSEDLWRKREQRSRLFLGKLRAVGPNDYVLYDNGICKAPKNDDIFDDMGDEEDDEVDDDDEDEGQATKKKNPVMEKMTRDAKAEGKSEEVSLYRRELLSIHFNTKHRPAPAGVRGSEICIPLVTSVQLHGKNGDAKGGASSTAPIYGISNPFAKIRDEGRQNELFAKTCYILHERTSR